MLFGKALLFLLRLLLLKKTFQNTNIPGHLNRTDLTWTSGLHASAISPSDLFKLHLLGNKLSCPTKAPLLHPPHGERISQELPWATAECILCDCSSTPWAPSNIHLSLIFNLCWNSLQNLPSVPWFPGQFNQQHRAPAISGTKLPKLLAQGGAGSWKQPWKFKASCLKCCVQLRILPELNLHPKGAPGWAFPSSLSSRALGCCTNPGAFCPWMEISLNSKAWMKTGKAANLGAPQLSAALGRCFWCSRSWNGDTKAGLDLELQCDLPCSCPVSLHCSQPSSLTDMDCRQQQLPGF